MPVLEPPDPLAPTRIEMGGRTYDFDAVPVAAATVGDTAFTAWGDGHVRVFRPGADRLNDEGDEIVTDIDGEAAVERFGSELAQAKQEIDLVRGASPVDEANFLPFAVSRSTAPAG